MAQKKGFGRRILDGIAERSPEFQKLKRRKEHAEERITDLRIAGEVIGQTAIHKIIPFVTSLTPEQIAILRLNPRLQEMYKALEDEFKEYQKLSDETTEQHKEELKQTNEAHKNELISLREELYLESTGRTNALQRDFANRLVALTNYLNTEGEKSPLVTYANGMLQENPSFQAYVKSKKLPELEEVVKECLEQNLTSRDQEPIIHKIGKYNIHIIPMYQTPNQPLAAVYLTLSNKPSSSLTQKIGNVFGFKGKTRPHSV